MKISTAISKASKNTPVQYREWYKGCQYASSKEAQQARRKDVAIEALCLMGYSLEDVEYSVYCVAQFETNLMDCVSTAKKYLDK